jgi:hypothetical protein
MGQLIEYIKIHLISLRQDWEDAINNIDLIDSEYHPSDDYFEGAIEATEHLLSVAEGILNGGEDR